MSFLKGVDIMPVDKSWINLSSRSCEEYINGVIEFVDYAFQRIKDEDMKIKCPCNDCNNRYRRTRVEVTRDLLWKGMTCDYTNGISMEREIVIRTTNVVMRMRIIAVMMNKILMISII